MLKKRRFKKENSVRVTFSLPAGAVREGAYVVGDFNDWQPAHALKEQSDGSWRVTIPLEPGRSYEFRYLVDGDRWVNEDEADRFERNPFGEENSVIVT
jgi:1,4-alpha-glucan branching enzyme